MEDETFGGYLKRRLEEVRTASSYPQAPAPAFPSEASMSSEMSRSPKKPRLNAAAQEEGTEKCANESLLVQETELARNDDGHGLVNCPENSALMELKRPKLDLKVSDKSGNPASDDSQGGDASGTQTSGADNSDEVLNSGSSKSTCSIKSGRGDEITSNEIEAGRGLLELRYDFSAYQFGRTEKSGNEAPVVEEVDRSCKHIRQALAEKSAAIELKEPKLDHEVLDNSVVMQEEEQKVDLSSPPPCDSSEEERSDMIDGQENQTA